MTSIGTRWVLGTSPWNYKKKIIISSNIIFNFFGIYIYTSA